MGQFVNDEAGIDGVPRKHPLAHCEDCPLNSKSRNIFVRSAGPEKARIAIVGEAPGAQEARTGVPFFGASGRLLNQVLKYHNIDRDEVFISNACLCRPKDNATPPAAAVVACRPRLLHEIQERGIQELVALGNTACQSIVGAKEGITRLRVGTGRTSPYLPGVRIIPTFHPAACLRSAAMFPSMANDFGKVTNPLPPWQPPQFRVFERLDEGLRALAELERRGLFKVTLDIEVAIDKDTSFDHPSRYGMLCIGLGYGKALAVVFGEALCQISEFLEALWSYLRKCKIGLQNGKFDLSGVYAKGGTGLKLFFDTMLASYVLDERPGIHGLKYNAVEILGAPRYDEEIKQYLGPKRNYGDIPKDILYKYNAYDVATTWDLWEYFEHKLAETPGSDVYIGGEFMWRDPGLRAIHDFLCEAAYNLMFTELNGIGVDLKYNGELSRQYTTEIIGLERRLWSSHPAANGLNPRSTLQVKALLHEMDVDIPKVRNAKGLMAETTNAEALQGMLEAEQKRWKGHLFGIEIDSEVFDAAEAPSVIFLKTLLAHRKASKMDGTYVKGLKKHVYKGRVYPTIMMHSTVSGRLSQRKPSLHNIPRGDKLRRQYGVVKPCNVFIEADYGQLELRVLTWLAKEEYFREVFSDPSRDLFDELIPVIQPERSSRQVLSKKDTRNIVKCYVYGLAYGREAKSIAEEFGMPVAEAQRGLKAFFSVIPSIVRFREEVKMKALHGEDLITPFGRHRRFWLVTEENRKEIMNEACAFYPQSIGSDICVRALNWLRPQLRGKAWCRNTVHDALYWECHERDLEEVTALVRSEMVRSAAELTDDYVPFKVGVDVGRNWGDLIPIEDWQRGRRPWNQVALSDQWATSIPTLALPNGKIKSLAST